MDPAASLFFGQKTVFPASLCPWLPSSRIDGLPVHVPVFTAVIAATLGALEVESDWPSLGHVTTFEPANQLRPVGPGHVVQSRLS